MNRRSEEGRLSQKAEVMLQTAGGPVPAYAIAVAATSRNSNSSQLYKNSSSIYHLLDCQPGGLEVAMAAQQPDILQLDGDSNISMRAHMLFRSC